MRKHPLGGWPGCSPFSSQHFRHAWHRHMVFEPSGPRLKWLAMWDPLAGLPVADFNTIFHHKNLAVFCLTGRRSGQMGLASPQAALSQVHPPRQPWLSHGECPLHSRPVCPAPCSDSQAYHEHNRTRSSLQNLPVCSLPVSASGSSILVAKALGTSLMSLVSQT